MLKNMPKEEITKIVDFVKDNYDTEVEYLIPQNNEELIAMYGDYEYLSTEDEYGIEALLFFKVKYGVVAEVFSVVVRLDLRNNKLTKELSRLLENMLLNNGVKKITSYISVKNRRSLIMSIKRDYIIEGLLKNQDGKGTDYYVIGKEL